MIHKLYINIRKITLLLVLLCLPATILTASASVYDENPPAQFQIPEKNYLYPILQTIGINAGIFAWNKYVFGENWTNIDYESINRNFEHGFGWDDDHFTVNQLGHPYQGGLYHTSARYYGLNYWESMGMAAFGSLQWEYILENQAPAINDLVTTTLSGAIFGEAMLRMSRLVLDRSPASKRILRELGMAAINPMVGFNRAISNDSFATRTDIKPVYFASDLAIGMSREKVVDKNVNHYNIRWRTHYGEPFKYSKSNLPFEFFNFDFMYKQSSETRVIHGSISGLLYKKLLRLSSFHRTYFGLFQNYDFYSNKIYELEDLIYSEEPIPDPAHFTDLQNAAYRIGTTSFGAGFFSRDHFFGRIVSMTFAQLVAIPLGGANSPYAEEDAGRSYNMGMGWGGKFYTRLFFRNYLQFFLSNNTFHIQSLSGGDGVEIASITNTGVFIPLSNRVHLGIEWTDYRRFGRYDDLPDIDGNHSAFQTFLSYNM